MSVAWEEAPNGPVVIICGLNEYVKLLHPEERTGIAADAPLARAAAALHRRPSDATATAAADVVRCITGLEIKLSSADERVEVADRCASRMLHVNVDDHPDAEIGVHLAAAAHFIAESLGEGRSVVVHCQLGVSRSSTVVAAFLILRRGMSALAALQHLQQRRPQIRPNPGFLAQLVKLELGGSGGSSSGGADAQRASDDALAARTDELEMALFSDAGSPVGGGGGGGEVLWFPKVVRVGIDEYFETSHNLGQQAIRTSSFVLPSRLRGAIGGGPPNDTSDSDAPSAPAAAAAGANEESDALQRAINEYIARVSAAEAELSGRGVSRSDDGLGDTRGVGSPAGEEDSVESPLIEE